MSKWKSVAVWPKGVGINLGNHENKSEDTHDCPVFAARICAALEQNGFGGNGKIFPLSTRVEIVEATND